MSYVVFENEGVIDERSIRTFGVSAKETENPIGFFGTGLKYAIAIILRHGLEIEMISDGNRFVFRKAELNIRGKPFEIVTMNEVEMPFTTKLGQNWQLWQAFRELYCNCLDENGTISVSDIKPTASAGKTIFFVKGQPFVDLYMRKELIVLQLPDNMKISGGDKVEVFNTPSQAVYYRKIKVMDLPKPGMFTYNIVESTELTEDRTLKYPSSAMQTVTLSIAEMRNKNHIRAALLAKEDKFEHDFSYSCLAYYDHRVSTEFFETLEKEFKLNSDHLNKTARDIHKARQNIQAVKNYEQDPMTEIEEKQLARASGICKSIWPDFEDYKILVVKTLGVETMALADHNQNTMVVSKAAFFMGTKYLMSTLLEEFTHLKTGHRDCTRALQTHLFDTICSVIESHVIKEPI